MMRKRRPAGFWFGLLAVLGLVVPSRVVHSEVKDGSTPTPASVETKAEVLDVASTVLLPTEVRLPPDYDPANEYDLLVALHGFGSSSRQFARISPPLTEAELIFAAPQAPTSFMAGESLGYDWDRAHDEPDGSERRVRFARVSIEYIVDVIEALQERYAIRDVYLFGFSQGGAYAYLVGIHHPDLVSGIVAVGMGFDVAWFEDGALESASTVPVLIAHSPEDPRVPYTLAEKSAMTLRSLDYDVSFYGYSGGHRVTPEVLERTLRWIERQTPGSEAGGTIRPVEKPEGSERRG
jgi:phospholipase/carboxylesterase